MRRTSRRVSYAPFEEEKSFHETNVTFSSSYQAQDSSYHFSEGQVQAAYHMTLENEPEQMILWLEHLQLVLRAEQALVAEMELRQPREERVWR